MYSVVFAISQRVLEYLIVLRDDILNSAEGAGFSESAKRARIGKAEGRCVKEQLTDYPSEYSCLLQAVASKHRFYISHSRPNLLMY